MSLQRKNNFKRMKISNIFIPLLVGTLAFTGLGGPKYLEQLIDEHTSSQKQTTLVEQTRNDEYTDPYDFLHQLLENESASQPEQLEETEQISEEEYVPKYNFDELRQVNPNTVAVIEGDIFEGGFLPVVESRTDEEVERNLRTSFDGTESYLGSVTTDPRNSEELQGNISEIWAHHFQGSEDEGRMFSSLVNYDNQEFYENHKYLTYYTDNGTYILEVFACIKDNPMIHSVGQLSEDEFTNEVQNVRNNSFITSDSQINQDDRVLVLTTCPREGSWNAPENIRVSVYTKIIPVYEKTMAQRTR